MVLRPTRRFGHGQHLPWFRSKEFAGFEPAARPALPTRRARNLVDLDALDRDTSRFIIQVAPDVELVREDDAFLDRVIAIASVRDLPVELDSSILGHAHYRLRGAGILVLVPQPKILASAVATVTIRWSEMPFRRIYRRRASASLSRAFCQARLRSR